MLQIAKMVALEVYQRWVNCKGLDSDDQKDGIYYPTNRMPHLELMQVRSDLVADHPAIRATHSES